MIKRRIFTLIFMLFTLVVISPMAYADNPPRKILTGWIPYYSKTGLSSAVVNSDLIQDVSPFWYSLTNENKIDDQYVTGNPNVPISVPIATLQSMNFNIIPTIRDGTGKGVLAGLLAKDSARANIITAILALINQYNYSGIDLDFENFAFVDSNTTWTTTAPLWTQFVKELSSALHAQNKLLSITTPVSFDPTTGKRGYYVYSWPNIGTYIDRLRIMTYDYSVSTPGPIGPKTWAEDAVKYAVSVMPASKVYVGIPGYGRDWITKVDGTCPSDVAAVIKVGAKAATFVLRDAANLATTYGATPIFNDKYAETNFNYQKTYIGTTSSGLATQCTASRTVWYQDAKGYAVRAALVPKYRLGGVAEWTLGMEDQEAANAIRDLAKNIAPDKVISILTTNISSSQLGGIFTLTSTFKLPDTKPLGGLPFRIESKNSQNDWHTILTGISQSDGTFSFSSKFGENTSLRVATDGTWERLSSQSDVQVLNVSRLISWKAPSSIKRGVTYQLTGSIQPVATDVPVNLLIDGNRVSTSNTDQNGFFSILLKSDQVGIISAKLMIDSDGKYDVSNSNSLKILVR